MAQRFPLRMVKIGSQKSLLAQLLFLFYFVSFTLLGDPTRVWLNRLQKSHVFGECALTQSQVFWVFLLQGSYPISSWSVSSKLPCQFPVFPLAILFISRMPREKPSHFYKHFRIAQNRKITSFAAMKSELLL